MNRRGEPLPINGALNRPRTKLGLELSAWMSIVFVTVSPWLDDHSRRRDQRGHPRIHPKLNKSRAALLGSCFLLLGELNTKEVAARMR